MIGLTDTTHSLEVVTGSALDTDYHVTYADTTASTHAPGSSQGTITTATTTTVLAAPGAATYRGVRLLLVANRGAVPQAVTVQKDISGTNYVLFRATLMAGESLVYSADKGFAIHDRAGRERGSISGVQYTSGTPVLYTRSMTAPDAANNWYMAGKDAGSQGAWSPGAPGVNGRVTDGTASDDAGCIPLANAPAGYQKYLKRWDGQASVIATYMLWDVLWLNTGLTVTTTTAQAITTPALPARDNKGEVNGEGCQIGLLVTTVLTNAALISNSTVSYTNSRGVAGRTATLQAPVGFNIPATAVVGTVSWFTLQAGDTGVKSIEGITLATSLVTGAVSLLIARPIAMFPNGAANAPGALEYSEPGIRIYDNACLIGGYLATTTTAPSIYSTLLFVDK